MKTNKHKFSSAIREPLQHILQVYNGFSLPSSKIDCGEKCRSQNPNNKPFCCDPQFAVPILYDTEYTQLEPLTKLWLPSTTEKVSEDIPVGLSPHICQGPAACIRGFRSISCRSFPFFPYVRSDYTFLGLAVEWEFSNLCWLSGHLEQVDPKFRSQFVRTYDQLFAYYQTIFDNYHEHSILCRQAHARQGSYIDLLHRNGKRYRINPATEKNTLFRQTATSEQ